MSISAILAKAFSTTLLGMSTVFALLIVISLIIGWLRYIPVVLDRLQKPKPTAVAPAASAASDAAGDMRAASGNDRRKLAAVMTAAIAAYEAEHGQAASGDDYGVRNIRGIRQEARRRDRN